MGVKMFGEFVKAHSKLDSKLGFSSISVKLVITPHDIIPIAGLGIIGDPQGPAYTPMTMR